MPEEAVIAPAAAAGKIEETPEFKEALAREREKHRLNLEAEYRRKEQELLAAHPEPKSAPADNGRTFFDEWGERHALPAAAGKELAEGVIGYITGTVLPDAAKTEREKQAKLRTQRATVRKNAKLAKLDDRFHESVMAILETMDPRLIGPDSYARALHMKIGESIEELELEEKGKSAPAKEPEPVPGPEPTPSAGGGKPTKIVLNATQQSYCEEKGFDASFFADMIKDRARKLESKGLSKTQVRDRIGHEMVGSIEW